MLVMNQDRRNVWNFAKEDFQSATITERNGTWCLFAYQKMHDPSAKYPVKRTFMGNYKTEEKAKTALSALMVCMAEGRGWNIVDETIEETEHGE